MSPLPAPPGAIDEIFRRASRRRFRQTTGSTLALALGVAVSLSARTGLPSGADRLDVATNPTSSAAPRHAVAPTGEPSASPAPAPQSSSPHPSSAPPSATPTPLAEPSAPPPAKPPMSRSTESGLGCNGQAAATTHSQFCLAMDAERDDTGVALSWLVCLQPGTVQSMLSFATLLETDFAVRDDAGTVVWQWSRRQTFDEITHTIVLDLDECLRWRVHWNADDEAGRLLAPGRYQVTGTSTATQFSGATLNVSVDLGNE